MATSKATTFGTECHPHASTFTTLDYDLSWNRLGVDMPTSATSPANAFVVVKLARLIDTSSPFNDGGDGDGGDE